MTLNELELLAQTLAGAAALQDGYHAIALIKQAPSLIPIFGIIAFLGAYLVALLICAPPHPNFRHWGRVVPLLLVAPLVIPGFILWFDYTPLSPERTTQEQLHAYNQLADYYGEPTVSARHELCRGNMASLVFHANQTMEQARALQQKLLLLGYHGHNLDLALLSLQQD